MDFADLKNGRHIVMKEDRICRITDVARSAPGKHGHAKKCVTGIDLFNGNKYIEIFTHHSHVIEPTIERCEYQGIMVDEDNYVVYIDENGEQQQDILLTEEQVSETEQFDEFVITVLKGYFMDSHDKKHNYEKVESIKDMKD